ncbi:MAG: hypothetical protein ABIJ26_08350, partial [Candidatus Margulisiibacteriota bacterium]
VGFINELVRLGYLAQQRPENGPLKINCSFGSQLYSISDGVRKKELFDAIKADGYWEKGKILVEVKYSHQGGFTPKALNQLAKYAQAVKESSSIKAVEYHITSPAKPNAELLEKIASQVPAVRVFWYCHMADPEGQEADLTNFGDWKKDKKGKWYFEAAKRDFRQDLEEFFGRGFCEIISRDEQCRFLKDKIAFLQERIFEESPRDADDLAEAVIEELESFSGQLTAGDLTCALKNDLLTAFKKAHLFRQIPELRNSDLAWADKIKKILCSKYESNG